MLFHALNSQFPPFFERRGREGGGGVGWVVWGGKERLSTEETQADLAQYDEYFYAVGCVRGEEWKDVSGKR